MVQVYDGTSWVEAAVQTQGQVAVPEEYVGQAWPYTPTWVGTWLPVEVQVLSPKIVRTIESFLAPNEVLAGDGVTDDSVVLRAVINRAARWAAARNGDYVVSLTRTYLCDPTIELFDIHPLGSLEFTGPGGTTRTYLKPDGSRGYLGSSRIQAQWIFRECDNVHLTQFTIEGWRVKTQNGGRNNDYEAQHAVWFLGCEDCQVRSMRLQHVMGDGVSVASNRRDIHSPWVGSDRILVRNNRIVNTGRLFLEPMEDNITFENNYCERNTSSCIDIESSGGTVRNLTVRRNVFNKTHGLMFHCPQTNVTVATTLLNTAFEYNVRINSDGECSFEAGGLPDEGGELSIQGFTFVGNIWDRPNGGGYFWKLRHVDGLHMADNHGPWRKIWAPADVIDMVLVTGMDGTPITVAEILATNPGVFRSPR